MATAAVPERLFDVREATEADRPVIEQLIAEMIPGVCVEGRWTWLYETNPGGRAITWLATQDGEVAGCTSFFPFRLWLDGAEVRGALGGDGYVRPAFRRKGLGALLHDASRLAMPAHRIACMYGAPGAMNVTPLKHGGSRECGSVVRYARPLRTEAVVGKSSRIAPAIAALGRLVAPAARYLTKRTRAWLDEAHPSDPRIDGLWRRTRNELRLAVIRDAAFYDWRFRNAPAQRQPTFIIMRDSQPIGACALEKLVDQRALRIVDLLASREHWHACLRAIAAFATDTEAELLDLKLLAHDARSRSMWKSGFIEREGKPFLCMLPHDGDRRFVDPERWFYTQADSDLDDHS